MSTKEYLYDKLLGFFCLVVCVTLERSLNYRLMKVQCLDSIVVPEALSTNA